MSDKTVTLTNRRVNQSLINRTQAQDNHLQKYKGDVEVARKHSSHQLTLKEKALRERMTKLQLHKEKHSLLVSQKRADIKADEHVVYCCYSPPQTTSNPYPVTFETKRTQNRRINQVDNLPKIIPVIEKGGDSSVGLSLDTVTGHDKWIGDPQAITSVRRGKKTVAQQQRDFVFRRSLPDTTTSSPLLFPDTLSAKGSQKMLVKRSISRRSNDWKLGLSTNRIPVLKTSSGDQQLTGQTRGSSGALGSTTHLDQPLNLYLPF